MKFHLFLWLALIALVVAEEPPPPGLEAKEPEKFDWPAYVGQGLSISDEMFRAEEGIEKLKKRMEEICQSHIALMKVRKDEEGLKLFQTMQEHWQAGMEAEVRFVGKGWDGGSGQRAAIPRARMLCYLRRVHALQDLKAEAMDLNE